MRCLPLPLARASRGRLVPVLALAVLGVAPAARAAGDGPVALVVNTDEAAFSWALVRHAVANAVEAPVVATDDPTASGRRGLLTVTWRPSRHELAVTYENPRGTISRIVQAPDAADAAVVAAASLAANLVRDQAAERLGDETAPAALAPAATPREARAAPAITADARADAAPVAPAPRWTVALLVGKGVGYAAGPATINIDRVQSGAAWASFAHVAPEVGFAVTPRVLVSVSARQQLVPATSLPLPDSLDCGADHLCTGPRTALAGFVKATYFGAAPERDFRPYVSLALGGGQIRYPIVLGNVRLCGAGTMMEACSDTLTSGPLLAGPGVGFRYRVARAVELVAGLELQLGAPRFTANLDTNLGAAVDF